MLDYFMKPVRCTVTALCTLCALCVATLSCSNPPTVDGTKYPAIAEMITEVGLPEELETIPTDSGRFRAVAEWVFETFPQDGPEGRIREYGDHDYDIDEMLVDAESGGAFQCNDRATIIARTMVALGYRGRQVPLRSRGGEGHMLAEAYLPDAETWMTYDPIAEQYFLIKGEPASALQLRDYVRAGWTSAVVVSSGPHFSEVAPYFANARMALTAEERIPHITPAQSVQFRTTDDCLVQFRGGHWYEWPIEQ